jgi:hypothetical protein
MRLFPGVRQAVANAAEDWGQVNSEMEKLWQKLTSLMADHGCSGSAMAQLMRLMTAGTIPPSLESFLIQNPGEGEVTVSEVSNISVCHHRRWMLRFTVFVCLNESVECRK